MRILGIDPGSTSMGYAVIEAEGSSLKSIIYGTTKIKAKDLLGKLALIQKETQAIVKKYKPDLCGVEKLFFAANKKTALEVAQARGVIIVTLLEQRLPIMEFTPAEVKVAITNYGAADKEMIRKMVLRLLNLSDIDGDDNAVDALAIAITTSNQVKLAGLGR